jgi:hypothetical protein
MVDMVIRKAIQILSLRLKSGPCKLFLIEIVACRPAQSDRQWRIFPKTPYCAGEHVSHIK